MRGATQGKWVVGAVAIALAATACGGGGGSSDSSNGSGTVNPNGIVRAAWGDPQNPLEPANTNEVQGGKVLDMIFKGLKQYNPKTGAAEDVLAQSITSTDQQTFTIKVKKGWKFTNGEAVTAKSFVDAWNYGALVTNKQLNSYFFADIVGYSDVHPDSGAPKAKTMSGLKLVDDYTFTVKLDQKFSTWPDRLGYSAFYPLPQTFFTNHAAYLAKPIGDGPYKIKSYTRGKEMQLVKNADFQGTDKPKNGGVDLIVYTDENTAYTDLQAGNVDEVDPIPATQLSNVKTDLNGRYVNQPAGLNQTIAFPLWEKQWSTPKAALVRQGLSMAIDRKTITDKIFQGTRTPATDWTSPVLGAAGGYKAGLAGQYTDYNPTEAKKLIQEGGGIPGGTLKVYYNADTGSHKEWVDAVCNSINNVVGSDKACIGTPVGTFADFRTQITTQKVQGAFRAGWQMDYPLIDDWLTPLYATGGSSNDSKYSNPKFDSLIKQANAEADTAKATKLYQDAEQLLVKDMPAIPLWYQNGNAGYSAKVSNVSLNAFSVPVFTNITVLK